MNLFTYACPECGSEDVCADHQYKTKNYGVRTIYHCRKCDIYFSETFGRPIAGLTTALSRIIEILKARSEGMAMNATARTFNVSKKSVINWERRLGGIKPTLMLYALLQKFIHQDIEGDELYTKVNQNVPAPDSEGWTIVLMERGSRFLWELQCGRKEQLLFEEALQVLAEVIAQTGSLNLFTDGERRYGNLLFDICHQVLRNGSVGLLFTSSLKGGPEWAFR
jgi:transposase-like protein